MLTEGMKRKARHKFKLRKDRWRSGNVDVRIEESTGSLEEKDQEMG